jgi:hypothetical protein
MVTVIRIAARMITHKLGQRITCVVSHRQRSSAR